MKKMYLNKNLFRIDESKSFLNECILLPKILPLSKTGKRKLPALFMTIIANSLIVTIANEPEDHSVELDCSLSKHECCPDGVISAKGPGFKDCKEDTSMFSVDKYSGNDASICALPEPTRSCDNYTIQWRFDISEGRCVQFWYGGCDGNANRFNTFEECEARCVSPNGTDKCKLPLVNSGIFIFSLLKMKKYALLYIVNLCLLAKGN